MDIAFVGFGINNLFYFSGDRKASLLDLTCENSKIKLNDDQAGYHLCSI